MSADGGVSAIAPTNEVQAARHTDKSGGKDTDKTEKTKEKKGKSVEITDVGEKIGGAKKDLYKETMARAKEDAAKSDDELRSWMSDKSAGKVFSFDVAKLRKGGLSNEGATFIQFVKDYIPVKPRKGWKVRSWLDKAVPLYRLCLMSVEDTEKVFSRLKEKKDLWSQIEARMAIGGYDSGLRLPKDIFLRQGEEGDFVYAKDGSRQSVAGKWIVGGHKFEVFDTRDEAVTALRRLAGDNAVDKGKVMKFVVYRSDADGKCYITPIGKSEVVVADGFETSTDAFNYIREHNAELQERYRGLLEDTKIEHGENRERKGRNWRDGKDVSADEFREAFAFRGVEFGNWMKQEDRRKALNEC